MTFGRLICAETKLRVFVTVKFKEPVVFPLVSVGYIHVRWWRVKTRLQGEDVVQLRYLVRQGQGCRAVLLVGGDSNVRGIRDDQVSNLF